MKSDNDFSFILQIMLANWDTFRNGLKFQFIYERSSTNNTSPKRTASKWIPSRNSSGRRADFLF